MFEDRAAQPAVGAPPAARDSIAAGIWRGAARCLVAADHAVLAELPLGNGRRADLVAIDRSATITIVEIKSGRADFVADRKWQAYLAFCDRFYFAVERDFPLALLPAGEGLMVADRFAGEIVREASLRPLGAARRKAMLLRFARLAAARLHSVIDPAIAQFHQPER
ncbi:MAG TPA: MmcB family DNA repair protein [Geminicoccaceae bacterium]|nr:MmcB family DNA repair protein [Geminicoccaceae bacterium]